MDAETCRACGAPLDDLIEEETAPPEPKFTVVQKAPKPKPRPQPKDDSSDLRALAEQASDLTDTVMYTYSVAWRTAAEAGAIAISALIIGMVAGAFGQAFWGVFGGLIVGVVVGLTAKPLWGSLLGAPAGTLVGLLVSALLWAIQAPAFLPLLVMTVGAVIGARVRALPQNRRRMNTWEKARPFVGAVGGLVVGSVGVAIGWGFSALVGAVFGA